MSKGTYFIHRGEAVISSMPCPSCKRKGVILYNPFNKVTQCHNCGKTIEENDDKERVLFV